MFEIKKESFGPHLMMDLTNCNPDKLKDYEFIFNVLNDLPEKIGMTKITQPYVFPYSGLVPEDKGITGTVIIAESHISIHTFQEKDYCFVDVFSCKDFDVEFAAEYIINAFECKKHEKYIVHRGKDFTRYHIPEMAEFNR
ncbi:S-adenosylmethionine decarboxylase proenzyme [Candidatus Omnitrophus magneticus]|uniref:S-adenosylmethionine decarboxylase proenzyme n=1 Tax=Candidatus Omnitrophus magneticus TaxID=1609969 RepID=A0A0F0CPL5_9BACT|nr:S-adenosylmethionine decarboxylase proenzyme [Candidatus Omnitrophus magneticus]